MKHQKNLEKFFDLGLKTTFEKSAGGLGKVMTYLKRLKTGTKPLGLTALQKAKATKPWLRGLKRQAGSKNLLREDIMKLMT